MQKPSARYVFLACFWYVMSLICYVAGIAASTYSHVSYFPSRAMYDEFYTIVLRVVDIAFEDFASLVQSLLVEHIRKTMSAEAATWYKEWWTGAKGRYLHRHLLAPRLICLFQQFWCLF